jgi:hypothetical protein
MMSAQLQLQQPSDLAASTPGAQALDNTKTADSHGSSDGPSITVAPLVNRVAQSKSPYVRARSNSPVAWQLLDDESVRRAKSENKLIFLSIGFLASHRKLTRIDLRQLSVNPC